MFLAGSKGLMAHLKYLRFAKANSNGGGHGLFLTSSCDLVRTLREEINSSSLRPPLSAPLPPVCLLSPLLLLILL